MEGWTKSWVFNIQPVLFTAVIVAQVAELVRSNLLPYVLYNIMAIKLSWLHIAAHEVFLNGHPINACICFIALYSIRNKYFIQQKCIAFTLMDLIFHTAVLMNVDINLITEHSQLKIMFVTASDCNTMTRSWVIGNPEVMLACKVYVWHQCMSEHLPNHLGCATPEH